jgi:hypothetical protein
MSNHTHHIPACNVFWSSAKDPVCTCPDVIVPKELEQLTWEALQAIRDIPKKELDGIIRAILISRVDKVS